MGRAAGLLARIVESAGKTPEALPLDSDPAESLSGFEKLIFHALGVSNG
jgi:hypothetical protein